MTTPSETFFFETLHDAVSDEYSDAIDRLKDAGYTNIRVECHPEGSDWRDLGVQPIDFPDKGKYILEGERNGRNHEVAAGKFTVEKDIIDSGYENEVRATPDLIIFDVYESAFGTQDGEWVVIENVIHKTSDEEWETDEEGEQLCWVRLPVAGGPYDTEEEAERAAAVDNDDYSVVYRLSKQ